MAHGTLEHGAGDQEATRFQAPRPWRIRACRRVAGEGRTAEDQVAAAAADEDEELFPTLARFGLGSKDTGVRRSAVARSLSGAPEPASLRPVESQAELAILGQAQGARCKGQGTSPSQAMPRT